MRPQNPRWPYAMPFALGLASAAGQLVSPYTGQTAPMAVCFAPGTTPEYMAAVTRLVDLQNQFFYGNADYHINNTWPVTQGSPLTLTWSFVPDGLSIPGGGGGEPTAPSNLFATMDGAFASQGGRAAWVAKFQAVFDRWSALTGVHYTRVTWSGQDWDDGAAWGSASVSGRRGDVRISMHSIDGPFGILAYDSFPTASDMVMDSDDADFFSDNTDQFAQLRNVVAHEHGHGLGLEHTCSLNSHILMEPEQESGFDGPQEDDIRAVQHMYGDPYEPHGTALTAKALGTLTAAGITFGNVPNPLSGIAVPSAALLSIDSSTDVDWYSFAIASSIPVGVTVTPVGSTYDNSPQAGSCPTSPTNFNALTVADLAMQIYSNGGSTLIGAANNTGLGSPESVVLAPLAPGTYYVKVYPANAPAESQLYRLNLTCPAPAITSSPTAQTPSAGDPLTMHVVASNAASYRWRRNGVNLSDGGNISGSGTDTLVFSPVMLEDTGNYSVAITNACSTVFTVGVSVTVGCYPNCDASTGTPLLNVADFTCFLQKFTSGDPYANCDQSVAQPNLNILDFLCFMHKMSVGCP